jgi:Zn-dependent M28 family amino/carboxypeptidase
MRFTVLFTLITTLTGSSVFAQSVIAPKTDIFSSKETLETSIKSVLCESDKRLEGVKALFLSVGATGADIQIEKYDKDKISNLLVRKKGTTEDTIVIGAHYDRTDSGCGVTDNWSGVTILAHIYKTLRPLTTKKTYVFVAFDMEEVGLKGSSHMLKAMPDAEIEKICSMVNFDSFGQAYPMALQNASSSKMLKLAEQLGKESGFKFNSIEIPGASADSASFLAKKIPAITLSGLGNNWKDILHSSSDKIEKVNTDSVYLGYRFGVFFISKLEANGCRDFR